MVRLSGTNSISPPLSLPKIVSIFYANFNRHSGTLFLAHLLVLSLPPQFRRLWERRCPHFRCIHYKTSTCTCTCMYMYMHVTVWFLLEIATHLNIYDDSSLTQFCDFTSHDLWCLQSLVVFCCVYKERLGRSFEAKKPKLGQWSLHGNLSLP